MKITKEMVLTALQSNPTVIQQMAESLRSDPARAADMFEPDALATVLQLDAGIEEEASARGHGRRLTQRALTIAAALSGLGAIGIFWWATTLVPAPAISASSTPDAIQASWDAYWSHHPLVARYPFIRGAIDGMRYVAFASLALKVVLAWPRLTLWGLVIAVGTALGGGFGATAALFLIWGYYAVKDGGRSSNYTASPELPRTSGARLASPPGQR